MQDTSEDRQARAKAINERCNAKVAKLGEECILSGHSDGSHEFYAALCGKMSIALLMEMVSADFWKDAHNEAIKVCSY